MTETRQIFVTKLTKRDKILISKFKALLQVEGKTRFSSDDFRMYNLDRYLYDKKHGIGGFFARLVKNKIIRCVGRTPSIIESNNMREIKLYEWIVHKEN